MLRRVEKNGGQITIKLNAKIVIKILLYLLLAISLYGLIKNAYFLNVAKAVTHSVIVLLTIILLDK